MPFPSSKLRQVPLKVTIFAWRLLRDRLPTKLNLVRRGVLSADDARCIAGCGHDESASYLFLHCDIFGSLWQQVRSWIGVSGVEPHDICDHFVQFIHYTGSAKKRTSFLQLIWLLCVWVVWNERYNRLFNNIQSSIDQLLEKVKFHSFWWLKAKNATFVYGSLSWWSDPLLCLGIDWPWFVIIVCLWLFRGGSLVHLVLKWLTAVVNIFHFYLLKKKF